MTVNIYYNASSREIMIWDVQALYLASIRPIYKESEMLYCPPLGLHLQEVTLGFRSQSSTQPGASPHQLSVSVPATNNGDSVTTVRTAQLNPTWRLITLAACVALLPVTRREAPEWLLLARHWQHWPCQPRSVSVSAKSSGQFIIKTNMEVVNNTSTSLTQLSPHLGPWQLAHGTNFQRLAAFPIFNWPLKRGSPNLLREELRLCK